MSVPILLDISQLTYPIPVIIGLARVRKLPLSMRLLWLMCLSALVEIAFARYVGHLRIKNYFVSEYYRIVEVSFVYVVYIVSTTSWNRKLTIVSMWILFSFVWLGTILFSHGTQQIGGGISVVARLFLVAASLVVIQPLMADSSVRLVDKSLFWMVAAVLIYSTGSMVVIGLSDRLFRANYWLLYVAYHVNWSLEIAANLLYSKALLCKL
jgi:hypothetical protein